MNHIFGWGGRVRTLECGSQSPMPYHLATPQCFIRFRSFSLKNNLAGVAGFEPTNDRVKVYCLTAWLYPKILWGGRWVSNPRPQDPQSCALTNCATSTIFLVCHEGFEPPTLALEGRCSIQLS